MLALQIDVGKITDERIDEVLSGDSTNELLLS